MSKTDSSPFIRPATLSLPQEWVLAIAMRAIANVDKTLLPPVAKDTIKNSFKIDPNGIAFPGGVIAFDGSLKKQIAIFRPGTDLKIEFQLSLVDARTVRIRINKATTGVTNLISKVPGLKRYHNLKDTVLLLASEAYFSTPALWPHIKFVDTETDKYFDCKIPVDFAPLKSISTDNGTLTIAADVPAIETLLSIIMANKIAALENTPENKTSLAAQIQANNLKSGDEPFVPQSNKAPAGEKNTLAPAPDVSGPVNASVKF